jgi:hypothetical protein
MGLKEIGSNGIDLRNLKSLLRVTPEWSGFRNIAFHLSICPLASALSGFITCWDKTSTFEKWQDEPDEQRKTKILHLAQSFNFDRPLFVFGFERHVLWRYWPRAYPNQCGSPDDFIVMDGNHRLIGLAARKKQGKPIPKDFTIGVFAGKPIQTLPVKF